MAKVETVVARKDYPDFGIVKGQSHFYVRMKTGPRSSKTMRSATPFKRSQLTSSPFLSQVYQIEDDLQTVADLVDANALADSLEELAQECRDAYDNMPEGLQQGDTGQLLEQRAEGCEEAANAIRDITDGFDEDAIREEAFEADPEADLDSIVDLARQTALDEIHELTIDY